MNQLIVRYGEISLKGNNRSEFEKTLVRNIRRRMSPWPSVHVERIGGRIVIELNGAPPEEVIPTVQKVFGIISISPVVKADVNLDAVREAAVETAREAIEAAGRPSGELTFKVEVKRANKRFPMKSPELAAELGGGLLAAFPGLRVDVHAPDFTVYVEIREEGAYLYAVKYPGLGGLPVGSSGKVGLLLSGGIDSPVAGWLAMKRGVEVEAIHFHSFPFTSERALQKVEDLAQILADWGGRVHLHVVHFTDVQTAIRKFCPEPLTITIMRRMMLRIAEQIASRRDLAALVTGESLGQVASQTLDSMRTINDVTRLPILRPLIAEDKVDIIRRARDIGTYETSILPYEDCCTIFVPKSPRTKPKVEEAVRGEQGLDIDALVQGAVERTEMKTFHRRT
ncbi:tRNA 4-thiouridine(8) synthase ThiI [Alicyclobacillus cycloheptanicus]|uniref:Probable tRNA sulfurtransferase n=1 Tax=Alicyclobacillus cycloheptanicus TaxID=1457 RepID=A0ABT9XM84_9BACL|nr:tRNA uracil 4-sulfurtransferase ThiI [Alicyclobacillus cycloheptanicus]MDQ0191240.1 thiamine biosynthesis protein ThiI [Alicyclobacillus cycloheptanicus]WDM01524.1 tRNA 4-thiouridine(8) synthase ThiI [Alicyclobacillus cycloheptanicus]